MPLISVIIPVYNTESYLRQCLDSMLAQTLSDIEIICVDDGSTDFSPGILQSYGEKDSRIKIINQANKGAGAARNTGLEAAAGEYVFFFDSDDYLKENALEDMYSRAQELDADICICNAQDFDSDSGEKLYHNYLRPPLPENETFNIDSFPEYFFTFTSSVTWNKLIRRRIFTDYAISFDSLRHINDVRGIFLAMARAKRIALVNKKLVFYRTNRKESLMNTYAEQADSVFMAYSGLKAELESANLLAGEQIRRSFNNKVWDIFIFTMRYCNSYADFEMYVNKLKNEWLGALEMQNLSKEYFYNADRGVQYEYLLSHSAGDFLFTLFCCRSDSGKKATQKAMRQKAKSRKLKRENERQNEQAEKLLADISALKGRVEAKDCKIEQKNDKIKKLREKSELKNAKIDMLQASLKKEREISQQQRCELKNARHQISKQASDISRQSAIIERQNRLLGRRLVRLAVKISAAAANIKKRFKHGR
ncbi:MAG: glycosyltransferase [Clostridiales bacterium]|nr:glycosyltransferase [Clostridiales bacterium]